MRFYTPPEDGAFHFIDILLYATQYCYIVYLTNESNNVNMKSAIILHGKPAEASYYNPDLPAPSKRHWLPWIQQQLIIDGVFAVTPDVPRPFDPVYERWKTEVERYRDLVRDGVMIGHSAAASFYLRWLSENPELEPRQLVMVAPYLDLNGKYGEFSSFQIDPELVERIGKITILNSSDDSDGIQQSVEVISQALPEAKIITLHGFGHFMVGNAMASPEFPELLDVVC